MRRNALAANAYGTHVAGDTLVGAFETINTSTIEQIDVVMIMLGSAEGSNCVRKKASRAAFPAMNCAPSSPEPIMAVRTVGSGRQRLNLIRDPASYRITRIRVRGSRSSAAFGVGGRPRKTCSFAAGAEGCRVRYRPGPQPAL